MTSAAPLRVAVLGARGRMGTQACAAVEAAVDLRLVAALGRGEVPADLLAARPDVVVDLTRPDAVAANVDHCVAHALPVVVGTSGVTAGDLGRWATARTGVLVVPNFAIGAVLMMRFAAEAAPYFDSVEIVELHHPDKADAPSGTARRTAELVSAARAEPSPDATVDSSSPARGADVAGVRVHSVRLRGLVAHQEVLLGGPGETLTIRHDSYDRGSFMPGLLIALRAVVDRPGLTVGLEHVLDTVVPAGGAAAP